MGYDQHDIFRDRLTASALSAARRGIAAMVLVEIVRWMPESSRLCSKTADELAELLDLPREDMLSAIGTLEGLGAVDQFTDGGAIRFWVKRLSTTAAPEQLQAAITNAISCHSMWKRRLRHSIDTGQSDISLDVVAQDDQCEFGKWLNGPALSEADRDGIYEGVRQLHANFHRIAAATILLALSGRKEEAERSMGAGGSYARASMRLIKALNDWRKQVKS